MRARNVFLITILTWLVGTVFYAYYWVTSILARPDVYGYEKWVMFPLMGFFVYRFPFLILGLVLLIVIEVVVLSRER
jgi:hypothetical protein